MSQGPTILLIEADPSLQRLIMLGLQHSGMQVIAARSLETLPMLETQSPDLLLLDVDAGRTCDWSLLQKAHAVPHLAVLPTIVLAWDAALSPSLSPVPVPSTQLAFLDKPFDARALYRTIKQLLAQRAAWLAAREAQAEAALMTTYAQHTAPSAWPLVTAAGLLLAVIGLLFHLALTAAGLLIVAVALLLWTTGARGAAVPSAALSMSQE